MRLKFSLPWILLASLGWGESLPLESHRLWSLASTAHQHRWVIIHTHTENLYHIEVIGRGKHDPVWKIVHLSPHIAITETALARSVIAPLTQGDVYPESFENGYAKWQQENNGTGGEVCQRTVIRCLEK
ncbi:MAG: DUF5086 family protein [Sulfuricurvum sp.]|jgi:hypothetical protein